MKFKKPLMMAFAAAAFSCLGASSAYAANNWTATAGFNAPSGQKVCVRYYKVRSNLTSTSSNYTKQFSGTGYTQSTMYVAPNSAVYSYTLWANASCSGTARRSGSMGVSSNNQSFQYNW